MNDTTKVRKPYRAPQVKTATPAAGQAVLLACTGQVDCDALFSLGYTCCAATEDECSGC